MAQVYAQRPSAILRELMPELAWLSPLDWYILDVTCTQRYLDLRAEQNGGRTTRDRRRGGRAGREQPGVSGPAGGKEEDVLLTGSEIPPWERQ